MKSFSGDLNIISGKIQNNVTILNNRSIAEEVTVNRNGVPFTGKIRINNSEIDADYEFVGKSLVKSAVLTSKAFNKGFFGNYGEYIVSIGLLLFAFSTVITWAYYGDRCSAYLFGESSIIYYRILYILAFFIAGSGYIDTEIIWNFALITVAASTLPNLISIFLLRNKMKSLISIPITIKSMTDVVIIGGGVIGLSIARELSLSGKETIVLEKNERAGDVTSSRNSGVIHAGIYYPEDFLKTKLCVEGNKLIYEYAKEKKINHKKYGKYIIATNKNELSNLEAIFNQGKKNNVEISKVENRKKFLKIIQD